MKFKNIIVGVIEETEDEFVVEQFLKNPDIYEVIDEKTKKEEKTNPIEETEEAEVVEEAKAPKKKK